MSTRTAQDIADDMRAAKGDLNAANAEVQRMDGLYTAAIKRRERCFTRLAALRDEFETLTN